MGSRLRQLHTRVETSHSLLFEAVEQQRKTQCDIDSLAQSVGLLSQILYRDQWGDEWVKSQFFDVEQLSCKQQKHDALENKLRDNKEEVEACVRSYGISACREISQYMFEYLPRELRDIVYQEINLDSYTARRYYDDDYNDENKKPTLPRLEYRKLGVKPDKLNTPLDYQFHFFERHYFQVSYMGSSFVRELADTHFRYKPFKVRLEELFSNCGHQDFFLVDKYGLGFPLGQLLSRVEIIITSLRHRIRDHLQPLMAIANTECVIELTSPEQLTIIQDFGQKDIIVTQEMLLEKISMNLSRMKTKGYYVKVWYQGKLIYVANEQGRRKPGQAFHTNTCSWILSTVTKQKTAMLSKSHVRPTPRVEVTSHSREVNPTITRLISRHPIPDNHHQDHRQTSSDGNGTLVFNVPSRHPTPPCTLTEIPSRRNVASAASSNDAGVPSICGRPVQPRTDKNSSESRAERTIIKSSVLSKRSQNEDDESLDDIKAFYEARRAAVRAFFDSRRE